MNPVSAQTLSEMVNAIVHEVQPEKIILFGSQVKGEVHEDSDIDLLIVDAKPFGADRCRRKEIARIRKSIGSVNMPVDVFLYSPDEITNWVNTNNHITSVASREGKVLYEKH